MGKTRVKILGTGKTSYDGCNQYIWQICTNKSKQKHFKSVCVLTLIQFNKLPVKEMVLIYTLTKETVHLPIENSWP